MGSDPAELHHTLKLCDLGHAPKLAVTAANACASANVEFVTVPGTAHHAIDQDRVLERSQLMRTLGGIDYPRV